MTKLQSKRRQSKSKRRQSKSKRRQSKSKRRQSKRLRKRVKDGAVDAACFVSNRKDLYTFTIKKGEEESTFYLARPIDDDKKCFEKKDKYKTIPEKEKYKQLTFEVLNYLYEGFTRLKKVDSTKSEKYLFGLYSILEKYDETSSIFVGHIYLDDSNMSTNRLIEISTDIDYFHQNRKIGSAVLDCVCKQIILPNMELDVLTSHFFSDFRTFPLHGLISIVSFDNIASNKKNRAIGFKPYTLTLDNSVSYLYPPDHPMTNQRFMRSRLESLHIKNIDNLISDDEKERNTAITILTKEVKEGRGLFV